MYWIIGYSMVCEIFVYAQYVYSRVAHNWVGPQSLIRNAKLQWSD